MSRYFSKVFYILWVAVKTLFLVYAVAFSIAGTALLVYAYHFVATPVHHVKYLVRHNPGETEYMKQYRAQLRQQGKPDSLRQVSVCLDSVSKTLQNAVIAAEDDGFYTHPGFDLEAIIAAADYNRDKNRIARGASTITQQLAENLFCDHEKNFTRKFKELGYALLLEKYLGKDRILELYLNYAQWGDNVFGCEAASQAYYKKPSSRLSLSEAARLAAVLAMPSRLSPLNPKSVFIQKRVAVIANNLYKRHVLDDSGYTAVSGLPPPKDSLFDSVQSYQTSGYATPDTMPYAR
jgi:monofunctional biosynthetic peptidoglycan transglycosylase